MTSQFGLLSSQQEAIVTLRLLEQGNLTCEEYAVVFQTHLMRSGYNDIAALAEFKRGLNKGLRIKLETTFPLPLTNDDGSPNIGNWVTRAIELDRQWRIAFRHEKGSKTSSFGQNNNQQNNNNNRQRTNTPSNYGNYRTNYGNMTNHTATYASGSGSTGNTPKDPNAMDIDRNRRSGNSRNFNDTTCYHCQRKGHFARDCPDSDKPKVFPTRGVRLRALLSEMTDEEREQAKKDLGF